MTMPCLGSRVPISKAALWEIAMRGARPESSSRIRARASFEFRQYVMSPLGFS